MRLTVGLVIVLFCLTFITEGSGSGKANKASISKNIQDQTTSASTVSERDDQEEEIEFTFNKYEMKKAWNSAARLTDRNPDIWRVDKNNNIILSSDYTISSPLAFRALMRESPNGIRTFEAVQEDFIDPEIKSTDRAGGLEYHPKNQEQDDLLSLIEIALMGGVSDDRDDPYCWCPSSIHQDLFRREDAARRWHMKLFTTDLKYGMAGHNLAFQHMRIALKNINHIPESTLNSMDQMHTTMYIHNFQPQCSDVIRSVNLPGDSSEKAEEMKNNWGLPLVSEFVVKKRMMITNPNPTIKPARLNKLISSSSVPIKKKPTTSAAATMSLSELEWPSLSGGEPSSKVPSKKKKLRVAVQDI